MSLLRTTFFAVVTLDLINDLFSIICPIKIFKNYLKNFYPAMSFEVKTKRNVLLRVTNDPRTAGRLFVFRHSNYVDLFWGLGVTFCARSAPGIWVQTHC